MCVLAGVVELAVLQDGVACASQPRQQGAASGAEVRPVWLGAGASREGGMQGSLAQVRWWSKALDAGVVAARRSSALVRGGADLEGAASWRSRARQSVAELDEVEGAWPMDHSALDPMGFLRSTSRRAKPSTHGLLQWVDADAMPHSGQACALGLSEQALRGREGPSVEGLVVPTREADLLHVDVQEAGLGVARAGKAAAVWPRGRVDVRAGWKVHIKVGRGAGLPLLRDSPPRAPILTAVHHVEPPAGGSGAAGWVVVDERGPRRGGGGCGGAAPRPRGSVVRVARVPARLRPGEQSGCVPPVAAAPAAAAHFRGDGRQGVQLHGRRGREGRRARGHGQSRHGQARVRGGGSST
jgi:hypothetical protein